MYHIILQFFGGDPHVPKPCQANGVTVAHAYWSVERNCHETPPIPAAEYESFYCKLPDKWRVRVLSGELPVKAAPDPEPFDDSPEPPVIADAPTDAVGTAAPAGTPLAQYRELRAQAKERGFAVPAGTTKEELKAMMEAPVPETA